MPLLPGSLRRLAMMLLAACVAAIAATGVRFAGYGLPGWLDATFDPRFQAQQGRFPALLDWLPHLGQPTVGEAIGAAFPSGHAPAVSRWRPASLCCSPTRRSAGRPACGCCSCSWRS